MHRIAYETITENDPKNWNEPLEFTINAINDRQYIDLYNSYIAFSLWFKLEGPSTIESSLSIDTKTTLAGIFEQANISNIIYFENNEIKNATFDSIRSAPDYRSIITYLFSNRIELEDLVENKDIRRLEEDRVDPRPLCNEALTFIRQEPSNYYNADLRIPCRHLFELANETNFINYKEITFKLFFKDPHRFLVNSDNYTEKGKGELDTDFTVTTVGYDNVMFMYHYYQDLEVERPFTLRNTPMQAFTFPLTQNAVDTRVKKSLLMNDVYRYLLFYSTRNNESSRVGYEFPTKITLAQQGRAFWSLSLPCSNNLTKEQSRQKLWDLVSYCINKPGQPNSTITYSTHSWTFYIYVLPIDELIDYDAPNYLDIDIELHNEDEEVNSRQLNLVFFGK